MNVQPAIVAELVHIHGPMKGSIQEFADDCISIGRHPSCSISFPSDLTAISRKHAEIVREGNRFKLVDHSTNGTFLNGRKVNEAYLKDGDVLEFSEGGPKLSFLSKEVDHPVASASIRETPVTLTAFEENVLQPDIESDQPTPRVAPHPDSISPVKPLPSPQLPVTEASPALVDEKVFAPLVIQFGPSIRTFRELPIILGSGGGSDFVIQSPALQQQHLQILFSRNEYWIRDLTGKRAVCINGRPMDLQSPVHANDIIRLSPEGPLLCFLGEGRFAEASEGSDNADGSSAEKADEHLSAHGSQDADGEGFWAKLRRRF